MLINKMISVLIVLCFWVEFAHAERIPPKTFYRGYAGGVLIDKSTAQELYSIDKAYIESLNTCEPENSPNYPISWACTETTVNSLNNDSTAGSINGLPARVGWSYKQRAYGLNSDGTTYNFIRYEEFNGSAPILITVCPEGSRVENVFSGSNTTRSCVKDEVVVNNCPNEGNPINFLSGDKFQVETDFQGRYGLSLNRIYVNQRQGWSINPTKILIDSTERFTISVPGTASATQSLSSETTSTNISSSSIGTVTQGSGVCRNQTIDWRIRDTDENDRPIVKIIKQTFCVPYGGYTFNSIFGDEEGISIRSSDGIHRNYFKQGTTYIDPYGTGVVKEIDPELNDGAAWVLHLKNGKREYFGQNGRLLKTWNVDFNDIFYTYNLAGYIASIANRFGDKLEFTYDGVGNVVQVLLPDGNKILYSYQKLNSDGPDEQTYLLTSVTAQDGSISTYHYENPNFPLALTGKTDYRGVRYATWNYDTSGRAISSEHGNGLDKYTFEYQYYYSKVTNPLGKVTRYNFSYRSDGIKQVNSVVGEASANCVASNQGYTYYTNGLKKTETDWRGFITEYFYDDEGFETKRIEALGTEEQRTVTTTWHYNFYVPTEIIVESASDDVISVTQSEYDSDGRLVKTTVRGVNQ